MENTTISTKVNKKAELASVYFNRYLVFRYVTAIFFFINLYWTILSFSAVTIWCVIPIVLLIVDSAIIIEQTSKYWRPTNKLKITKRGYFIQIIANLIGLFLVCLGHHRLLFPFISEKGKSFLGILLVCGCLLSVFLEWHVYKVEHNQDSYVNYIKNRESEGE